MKNNIMQPSDARQRNIATIVYPESAPSDWLDVLDGLMIKALVSPCHDKDVLEDGSPKKPHYHVLFYFPGKKSYKQIKEIVDLIGGVGIIKVLSFDGYAQYLCHLNHKDKYQYPIEEVKEFCGMKYQNYIKEVIKKDDSELGAEIRQIILDFNITNYFRLMRFVDLEHPEYRDYLERKYNSTIQYMKAMKSDSYMMSRATKKALEEEDRAEAFVRRYCKKFGCVPASYEDDYEINDEGHIVKRNAHLVHVKKKNLKKIKRKIKPTERM